MVTLPKPMALRNPSCDRALSDVAAISCVRRLLLFYEQLSFIASKMIPSAEVAHLPPHLWGAGFSEAPQ